MSFRSFIPILTGAIILETLLVRKLLKQRSTESHETLTVTRENYVLSFVLSLYSPTQNKCFLQVCFNTDLDSITILLQIFFNFSGPCLFLNHFELLKL